VDGESRANTVQNDVEVESHIREKDTEAKHIQAFHVAGISAGRLRS
jgi:hypothetical protein